MDYFINGDLLIDIGDAIRRRNGETVLYAPAQMPDKIDAIPYGITDVSTAAEMNTLLTEENNGRAYRYIGTTDTDYTNGDIYIVKVFGAYVYYDRYANQSRVIEPLNFTALEANSTITMTIDERPEITDIETSVDNGATWTRFIPGTTVITLENVGDKVFFRGNSSVTGHDMNFIGSGKLDVAGNIMTMINKNGQTLDISPFGSGTFESLFADMTALVHADALLLPSKYVPPSGYAGMFKNCTNLLTAPELPATTLSMVGYSSMFEGCTSLVSASKKLPFTDAPYHCCNGMFKDCSSLISAPELPATTLGTNCYYEMFSGCEALETAPSILPALVLAEACYHDMFAGCENLTTPPELPATTLAYSCYSEMFVGCFALASAPQLPATTLASYCYNNMFNGCRALTTPPELPATELASGCYQNMFYGCSSLASLPELPATELQSSCYYLMFWDCASVKLATTQDETYKTPYRIPTEGDIENVPGLALQLMFSGTGGTFTGTPNVNTTYYGAW